MSDSVLLRKRTTVHIRDPPEAPKRIKFDGALNHFRRSTEGKRIIAEVVNHISNPDIALVEGTCTSPLHVAAARKESFQKVKRLLKARGIDKNARNEYGETALLLSLRQRVDKEIINLLVEGGGDYNIGCSKGITPLHFVVVRNDMDLLQMLIVRGANVDAASTTGVTPLHLAVFASNYQIVRLLLEHNADPTLVTSLEFPPLQFAISHSDREIFDLLYTHTTQKQRFIDKPILYGRYLVEAARQNTKYFFDLFWPRFDQEDFREECEYFLYTFKATNIIGNELIECLKLIFQSKYAILLLEAYHRRVQSPFLSRIFEPTTTYQLTNDQRHEILKAMPIAFDFDVVYMYREFNVSEELMNTMKLYDVSTINPVLSRNMYLELLCCNRIKTFSPDSLKILAPYKTFRNANGILVDNYFKRRYEKWCKRIFTKRIVASLQELSRDKIRDVLFSNTKRPYLAISNLPIAKLYKDILSLKIPIYS